MAIAGVDWAPPPLGIEGDRERLSFVEDDVPVYPLPGWVWDDAVLEQGARRLRQLHDASIGLPADGAIVGAIEFDMCSPGPRLWDIAYFATRTVPLTATPQDNALRMEGARRRVDLILRAYGSDATWDDMLRVSIIRLHNLAQFSIAKAAERTTLNY